MTPLLYRQLYMDNILRLYRLYVITALAHLTLPPLHRIARLIALRPTYLPTYYLSDTSRPSQT